MALFTAGELEEIRKADEELDEDIRKNRPRADRTEWFREYYRKNKEHILQVGKQYRKKNRDVLREKAKAYREKNREAIAAKHKAWYQANKERIKAKSIAYHYEHRDACLEAMRERKRRLKKEAQT